MSFTDLLMGICLFVNAVKGVSSLQFARDMGCHAKTAFVMLHKLREAVAAETKNEKLFGEIEIDGAYFGGQHPPRQTSKNTELIAVLAFIKPASAALLLLSDSAKAARFLSFRPAKRTAFVIASQRGPSPVGTMIADEGSALGRACTLPIKTQRINHSEAYSLDGVHTNFVESYFSRLRRMVQGQHHFVSARHLGQYASEAAWKEDHRRLDNGALAHRALGLALNHSRSQCISAGSHWHR